MTHITTVEELEAIYATPAAGSLKKVATHLTPHYRTWIERSKFCVLTTVGPEGTDGSPRGDDGSVVTVIDEKTVAMPDWHGNNRIDSLRNIVRDGRVSLMFMVPGSTSVIRLNGSAKVTADPETTGRFDRDGKTPRSVIVVHVEEIYFQCARALLRSGLWTDGDCSEGLPTPGQLLAENSGGDIGGDAYDQAWPERAKTTMW